jgi:hypothetical protein
MASNTVFMADASFEAATNLVTATTFVGAVWHIHQRNQSGATGESSAAGETEEMASEARQLVARMSQSGL